MCNQHGLLQHTLMQTTACRALLQFSRCRTEQKKRSSLMELIQQGTRQRELQKQGNDIDHGRKYGKQQKLSRAQGRASKDGPGQSQLLFNARLSGKHHLRGKMREERDQSIEIDGVGEESNSNGKLKRRFQNCRGLCDGRSPKCSLPQKPSW